MMTSRENDLLFDLCLIKHVLTIWPLTSTSACLVTKQCLMVFGRQTFPVCPGPYILASHILFSHLTSLKHPLTSMAISCLSSGHNQTELIGMCLVSKNLVF